MQNNYQTIIKNIIFLMLSTGASQILLFIYFILLSRYLGPSDYGIYSFATTVIAILAIFSDLGTMNYGVMKISGDLETQKHIINLNFTIKLILNGILFFILIFIIILLKFNFLLSFILIMLFLANLFDTIMSVHQVLYYSHEKMEYIFILKTLSGIVLIIGIILVLKYNLGLIAASMLPFFSNFFIFLISSFIVLKSFVLPGLNVDFKFIKSYLKDSIYFSLNAIYVNIFVWGDLILVWFFLGDYSTGIYNAAFKLYTISLFIPSAIASSFFPRMNKRENSSTSILTDFVQKQVRYLFLFGISILIIVQYYNKVIVNLILGSDYLDSAIIFNILIILALIMYIRIPFEKLIEIKGKAYINFRFYLIIFFINIIVDLFLLYSKSTLYLVVLSTLLLNIILSFGILFYSYFELKFNILNLKELKTMVKITFAGLVSFLLVILFLKSINFIFVSVIFFIVFIFVNFLMMNFEKEETDFILNKIKSLISKY